MTMDIKKDLVMVSMGLNETMTDFIYNTIGEKK